MKTIFFGSSNFSLPFFELCKEKTELMLVISTEDKPKGRGQKIISNPVKCVAQGNGLTVLTPIRLSDPFVLQEIKKYSPDLIVTASYGKLIPEILMQSARFGAINVHPSLLPKYRGAEPLFWQIAMGERVGGVTIFQMSKGLDDGDILLQQSLPINETDNYEFFESQCIRVGMNMLKDILEKLSKGDRFIAKKQNGDPGMYARKITEQDERIYWSKPMNQIVNQVRAFSPHIGAYAMYKGKRIKILDAKVTNLRNPGDLGSIMIQGKKIFVRASDAYVKLESLKPEGKNLIKSEDFINGYLGKESNPRLD